MKAEMIEKIFQIYGTCYEEVRNRSNLCISVIAFFDVFSLPFLSTFVHIRQRIDDTHTHTHKHKKT